METARELLIEALQTMQGLAGEQGMSDWFQPTVDKIQRFLDGNMGSLAWCVDHDQEAKCGECGHAYRRHFDSFEEMAPIGCKYCPCFIFV